MKKIRTRISPVWRKEKSRLFGALGLILVVSMMVLMPLQTLPSAGLPTVAVSIAHAAGETGNQKDQSLGCSTSNFSLCLANLVYWPTVGLMSWLLFGGAIFLGAAVKLSLTSGIYAMNFVSAGWEVIRDLANMFFLFILIYISFTIMLRAEHGGTMTTLAWVIAMALLVNFSFLLTRMVIDAGNIIAVQIYNVIPADGSPPGSLLSNMGAKDLSSPIMNGLDFQKLYNTQDFQKFFAGTEKTFTGGLVVLITLSIIFIASGFMLAMLAFAFFTAGALFLMRVVVLWIVIAVSPLAFVMRAVPHSISAGGAFYKRWQDNLINQTIYPAVFLFVFLFIAIFSKSVLGGGLFGDLVNVNGISTAGNVGTNGNAYVLGSIVIALALKLGFVLLMFRLALRAADKVSLETSEYANKFSNMVTGTFMRHTYGQGAQFLETGKIYGQKILPRGLANTRVGNWYVGQKLRGWTTQKVANKEFGTLTGKRSYVQYDKEQAELKTKRQQGNRDIDNRKEDRELATLVEKGKASGLNDTETNRKEALEGKLKQRGLRESEAMDKGDLKKVIHLMTASQLEAIKKSEKFSEKDRGDFNKLWHEGSGGAPLQKADKMIKQLRLLRRDLLRPRGPGTATTALDEKTLKSLAELIAKGKTVREADIKMVVSDTRKNIAARRGDIDANARDTSVGTEVRRARAVELRTDQDMLQQALDALKNLEDARKDTPGGGIGGTEASGTFIVKSENNDY